MDTEPSRAIRALPFVMFLIFAVFWSSLDLIHGVELAALPTLLVAVALVVRVVSVRKDSQP